MATNKVDQIKYKILKFLDVTGFTVFDPVVRLIFNEEPQVQIEKIGKYIVVPVIFVLACIGLWFWVGPNHKTKSGEVPTPDIVLESKVINDTIAKREKIKEHDFLLSGTEREQTLAAVEKEYETKSAVAEELKALVAATEQEHKELVASQIKPLEAEYDAKKVEFKAIEDAREAKISHMADKLVKGQVSKEDLLAAYRDNELKSDAESDILKEIKSKMDDIRSEKYKPLELARKQYDSAADEIFFIKTRLEFLGDRNLSVKLAEEEADLEEKCAAMAAAKTPKEAEKLARAIARTESTIERLKEQEYASAVTLQHQIKRSLFTVFIGFIIAAMVAIPVGILCGLNRVFMACMTPLISIFKPVSPVVWLLIFQIVVGAFFPDPESHPFFLFFDSMPLLKDLDINPALVFSACTVAMCAVWPALVNTALGVASVDKDHINVARVLKLGFWERLFKIVVPSALPLIFAGLRISLGVGWMVLIAAEALSSSDGLGKFVWDEYQNGSSLTFANIIMVCFVVGIIGFFLDRMMIVFQRLVSFDGAPTAV